MSNSSTPNRYKTNSGITIGGRAYEDDEQTRFAFICSTMGFGLPSFDDFIDRMPDGVAKQELLDWRQQAFKAFKSRNQHALKGWLQAAYSNWKTRLTIDNIRPTLSMGLGYSGSQSEKGERGAEARWGLTEDGVKMTDIVERLALSREHMDETAPELWPCLYAELDELNLNPVEHPNSNQKKASITCDGDGKITYGAFANAVSGHRKVE